MASVNTNSAMREELVLLNKHFQLLQQYLRANQLKKIPVHILLGHKGSGKTSILSNSELEFNHIIPAIRSYKKELAADITQAQPVHSHLSSEYCHWWITKQGIFLDIPYTFLQNDESGLATLLWQQLLSFLKKERSRLSLHSIIYVLSLNEIINLEKETQPEWLSLHKQRIIDLSKKLSVKLPLYFLVSKCDLLHGFSEFFDDLRSDERSHCLGYSLVTDLQNNIDSSQNNKTLTDVFNINFDHLLDRLNANVITRLHQEHNLSKRAIIKEFPLQFETLQATLATLIDELGEKTLYCDATKPQGIYFCSMQQERDHCVDRLQNSLHQAFEFAPKPYQTPLNHYTRSYFINSFLIDLLANPDLVSANKEKTARFAWLNKLDLQKVSLISGTSLAVVLLASLGFWRYIADKNQLAHSLQALQQVETQLSHANPNTMSFSDDLTTIAMFDTARNEVIAADNAWLLRLDILNDHHLQRQSEQIYQTALEKLLLPQIKNGLESELLGNIDPNQLYTALKAYLMLGHPARLQSSYIAHWAMHYWQADLKNNPNLNQTLSNGIGDLFASYTKSINLNPLAISQARMTLSNLPPPYLAYLIIINKAQSQFNLPFSINNISFANHAIVANDKGIPYLYTAAGFQEIFIPAFINLSNRQNSENWVLSDNNTNTVLSNLTPYQSQILDLYFRDYANWWQNYLNNVVFGQLNSLAQITNRLTNYINQPLLLQNIFAEIANNMNSAALLNNLDVNTALKGLISDSMAENFSAQFNSTAQVLAQIANNRNQYSVLVSRLKNFTTYLKAIQNSNDPNQAAFELATLHASQNTADPLNSIYMLANNEAAPIQNWLTNLANSSWQNVLSLTKNYLNLQWQTQIISIYNAKINNRFPVFGNANTDISLADFTQFFSPSGDLAQFFDKYLKPFIDTTGVQWQWKNINGYTMPIDNAIPQLFERARIIRQMFFPDNTATLQVHFSLAAVQVQPLVEKMQLNLNGQTMLVTAGQHMQTDFIWPGNNPTDSVSIVINNLSQQQVTDTRTGAFALFRLLNDVQVETTLDPRKYIVAFAISGTPAAQYVLQADNAINPFIPNIIDEFRCPATL